MARARTKHAEVHEEGPSSERWLLTYSDMITLLMVLFIVLFALGQTDIRKFNAFKDSFHQLQATQMSQTPQGGPGVLSQPSAISVILTNPFAELETSHANSEGGNKTSGDRAGGQQTNGDNNPGTKVAGHNNAGHVARGQKDAGKDVHGQMSSALKLTPQQERLALSKAARELEAALKAKDLQSDVSINLSSDGLIVSILTDKVLFPVDSAVLQPEGVEVIDAVGPVLATLPNQIDVEGDTDDTPITGGPYKDNWELSTARAVAVLESLIHQHGISPYRLEASGYGDTRPLVPNNTPQHRAENRRVELVILSTAVSTP